MAIFARLVRRLRHDDGVEPPLVPVDTHDDEQPSTQLAYAWAEKSHDWVIARILAQVERVNRTLTFAATLSLAAPTLIKDHFESPFFIVAMMIFLLVILYGVLGGRDDSIRLPAIGDLRANTHLPPEIFQRGVLYTAERNWRHNVMLLDRVAGKADKMTALLALETVCLVLWVVWP